MADILMEIFGDSVQTSKRGISPEKQLKDKERTQAIYDKCKGSIEQFARTFFADQVGNKWSRFHYETCQTLEDIVFNHKNEETKTVRAAPRGHAKSTFISYIFILWCICYQYKKTIILISCSSDMARLFLTRIRIELESNQLIKDVFGDLQDNAKWNSSELLTSTGIYFAAKGAGQQMRGLNLGSRPDLVVIDDLESEDLVATEAVRNNLRKWFQSAVMQMGSPTCDFFFVGTVLSYDSLLYQLLTSARYSSWKRKIYRAVEKFSESPLWETWEEKMVDLSNPNAYQDAMKLFEDNREEMLKDTQVLWEDQRKDMYLYLMVKKLEDEESFNSEFMNDPQTESSRVFKEIWLKENMYEYPPNIRRVYGAVDPSCGKSRRADTSAIIILGEGEDNFIYVLEASVRVRKPDEIIKDMEDIIGRYYELLEGFVVETNQFQSFFATTVQQRFLDLGLYVNWIEIVHGANDKKAQRINSMIPKIKNGYIKFHKNQILLLRQLKNYPKDKDDAVDCLEMALRPLLQSQVGKFVFGSCGTKKGGETNADLEQIKKNFGF